MTIYPSVVCIVIVMLKMIFLSKFKNFFTTYKSILEKKIIKKKYIVKFEKTLIS